MVVIWLDLLLLSYVSKHNIWSYYDWVYCCCRPSVSTICGRIMIGLSLLSSVSKHTMWSYYDWVYCCFRSSLNAICGRIMIGLSFLSSVIVLLQSYRNDLCLLLLFTFICFLHFCLFVESNLFICMQWNYLSRYQNKKSILCFVHP